jgi:uncharacterized protein DUF6069
MSELVAERIGRGTSWWTDSLVAVVAAGAAAVGWAAAHSAGIELAVRSGTATTHVGLASAVAVALIAAIAGAVLLRLLERRETWGLRVWTAVAGAVWLVSLSGPFGALTVWAGLVLAGLHLAVGAVVFFGLRYAHAPRRNA